MARPQTRTEQLDPAETREIRELFGTLSNARVRLGLEHELSAAQFYQALRDEPVTEHVAVTVQDAWRAWKRQYVHGYMLAGRSPGDWRRLPPEEERHLLRKIPPAREAER